MALPNRPRDEERTATPPRAAGLGEAIGNEAWPAQMSALVVLPTRGPTFWDDAGTLAGFGALAAPPTLLARTLRHPHRHQQVADCPPAFGLSAAQGEALLKLAGLFGYALEVPLTQWKQGRAIR